jgi:hypothetical protein
MDFAKRYVRDYQSMENEADQLADQYIADREQLARNDLQPFGNGGFSTSLLGVAMTVSCFAPLGVCPTSPGPIGSTCTCTMWTGEQHMGMRR